MTVTSTQTPAETEAAQLETVIGEAIGIPAEEMYNRGKLAELLGKLQREATDPTGRHSNELLGDIRRQLNALESEIGVHLEPTLRVSEWLETVEELPPCHVPGLFEAGDRVCITGQSKARKSFFALQLAITVATGIPFLYFGAGSPRRVLLVNLEIKSSRYQRRVRNMAKGLGLANDALKHLSVWNAAKQAPGVALWLEIMRRADAVQAEVVIVDPLYRTFEGDESDPLTVKRIVSAMTEITAAGRSLVYNHHTPKGRAGDRQAIDRGSGSGIWVRDVSTLLSIVEHQQEGLLVCETITRDHPPRNAETIQFDSTADCFRHIPDMAPAVKTTASSTQTKTVLPDLDKVAIAVTEPMLYGQLRSMLRERLGIAKGKAEQAITAAVDAGKLECRPARGKNGTFYGQPGSFIDRPGAPWVTAPVPASNTIISNHPERSQDNTGQ